MSGCSLCIQCTHKHGPQMKFDSRIRPLKHNLEVFTIKHGCNVGRCRAQKKHIHIYKLHGFKNHIHMRQLIVEMLNVLHFNSKINYTIVAAVVTFQTRGRERKKTVLFNSSFTSSFLASLFPLKTIESSSVTPERLNFYGFFPLA